METKIEKEKRETNSVENLEVLIVVVDHSLNFSQSSQ
jgi:hypothetical protein